MPRPRVIILNGVGSVGKSSTARALQTITTEPFLHVAMDAFLGMLPPNPDGLIFETVQDEGKPSIVITTGPVVARAMRGMRHAIAAMAAQGNNLIVDEVMFGQEALGIVLSSYYRIMLGAKSIFAQQCHDEKWFGGDWGIKQDLSKELVENWRDFNAKFIPVYLQANLGKSKVAAGLACGMLHTICKGINQGDVVLYPDGKGSYWAGIVTSDYVYAPGEKLPHRRRVEWMPKTIARSEMSEGLRNSTGAIGTVSDISKHVQEIEGFLAGNAPPKLIATDELVEDPSVFALEAHLEDFLVQNWTGTELGKSYDIFLEDGERTL